MSELNELYQEMILEHNKSPRNYSVLDHPDAMAEGYNPLCGDRLKLYLKIKDDVISEIGFQGSGCAISKSSASLMTTVVKGKKRSEAENIFKEFHNMLSGKAADKTVLGKLTVFAGVNEYPARVKCASLAWHTLKAGLEHKNKAVTTEDNVD